MLHVRGDEPVRSYFNVTMTEAPSHNRIWREKGFGLKTGVQLAGIGW